jgi:Zn-dependent protease with chaperone function
VVATVAVLAALAAALLVPAPWALARARWVSREPRAALVLWQALGLAGGLAAVGTALATGVAPLGGDLPGALAVWLRRAAGGDPSGGLNLAHAMLMGAALGLLGWLLAVTGMSSWRTWWSRRRQRELVDLVSRPWPGRVRPARPTAAARVIDHPAAAAYCLPGHDSRVVVTTGALDLLDADELDAVLAHEHAHLAERHDLVILPFVAWASALPWLPGPRQARAAVQGLVEMVADDRACVGRDRHVLAAALARVGSAAAPAGAVGSTEHALLPRVRRLLDPPRRSAGARGAAYLAAAALLALPTLALTAPAWF